jgi:GNAT superfamily N-acetyltransferase
MRVMTVYRKLLPTEASVYRDHLMRLNAQDRYARFCGFATDERIAEHCQRIDWRFAIIVGCFVRGELRAAAELRTEPKIWPGEGELALSVEPEFQNQGLGSGLMRRILTIARNRGIRSLTLICLIGNRRMQALTRRFLGELEAEGGEAVGRISLRLPNQLSLLQEAVDRGTALVNVVLDQWQGEAMPQAA